ncbi:MAG: hypothetical protein KJ950_15855 [Proteobacteria bacterium]|nr:hypothetical protein [Pseudomonadota bacterium]MBU1688820.1 hypothetical protein [Pseudomonadota bacterium]
MKKACRSCGNSTQTPQVQNVTHGLCPACTEMILGNPDRLQSFLNKIEVPTLLMQSNPRLVVTANHGAQVLFGKSPAQVSGLRGGQVFECRHSFSEAGCGLDENCLNCTIKEAVIETLTTGVSQNEVQTVLPIKTPHGFEAYGVSIATERIGPSALLAIRSFTRI